MGTREPTLQNFLERQVEKYLSPIEWFIHKQTTAALFLFIATVLALFLANSPLSWLLSAVSDMEFGLIFHDRHFVLSVKEWLSSGLMALFFFLIGLELKREIIAGKLRHPHQAVLIIMAAIGGMAVPALIYALINSDGSGAHGWAIPMATDTAFAMGVLALMARRVSYGISIFLIALAIFDDIGAIAVIAFFYTAELDVFSLLKALIPFSLLLAINVAGIRKGWIYMVLGIILWWLIHQSGIHATLAGLLMAVMVPARTKLGHTGFVEEVGILLSRFNERGEPGHSMLEMPGQHSLTADIEEAAKSASTPLQRWETFLINPVGIFVLPLFALFNANISLSSADLAAAFSSPVTLGIIAGLCIGKPLGIGLFTFAGLWLKWGTLPEGMRRTEIIGVGILAGIGFTMSLFITALSFEYHPELVEPAKTGVLVASLLSAVAGGLWLFFTSATVSSSAKEGAE